MRAAEPSQSILELVGHASRAEVCVVGSWWCRRSTVVFTSGVGARRNWTHSLAPDAGTRGWVNGLDVAGDKK